MSLAIAYCRAQKGMDSPLVTVEAHVGRGHPGFSIVGLPEKVVKESKDRVRGAILNCHFKFPAKRIIVNLGPADLPKEGGRFDLPIALSILAASNQIPKNLLEQYEFAAELALSGELRPFKGALPFALASKQQHRSLVVHPDNAEEAALVPTLPIFPATHLLEVCEFLKNPDKISSQTYQAPMTLDYPIDMSDVRGQETARRALEIAAAGGHSLLMIGSPGSGKTLLATRFPTILPPLSLEEALESAAIASLTRQGFNSQNWQQRPFRSPHHTSSAIALIGGGSPPKPGEISLAHHGVLFLDETPEFNRHALEVLRQPLESGKVFLSRATHQAEYPAKFQLICAMNPCPCGYLGHSSGKCQCTPDQISRYQNKLSGPLLDRIDLHLSVQTQNLHYSSSTAGENSADIRKRVVEARERQIAFNQCINAELTTKQMDSVCKLSKAAETLLEKALSTGMFSNRAFHRLLKVSRTIADLAKSSLIHEDHLAEAMMFRSLDHDKSDI